MNISLQFHTNHLIFDVGVGLGQCEDTITLDYSLMFSDFGDLIETAKRRNNSLSDSERLKSTSVPVQWFQTAILLCSFSTLTFHRKMHVTGKCFSDFFAFILFKHT